MLPRFVRNLRRSAPDASAAAQQGAAGASRRLPVHILAFELRSTNITSGGLQVECPGRRFQGLRARWSPPATPVRVMLPDGASISAECEVIDVSHCEDDVIIGLGFVRMDDLDRERWNAYVSLLEDGD